MHYWIELYELLMTCTSVLLNSCNFLEIINNSKMSGGPLHFAISSFIWRYYREMFTDWPRIMIIYQWVKTCLSANVWCCLQMLCVTMRVVRVSKTKMLCAFAMCVNVWITNVISMSIVKVAIYVISMTFTPVNSGRHTEQWSSTVTMSFFFNDCYCVQDAYNVY